MENAPVKGAKPEAECRPNLVLVLAPQPDSIDLSNLSGRANFPSAVVPAVTSRTFQVRGCTTLLCRGCK